MLNQEWEFYLNSFNTQSLFELCFLVKEIANSSLKLSKITRTEVILVDRVLWYLTLFSGLPDHNKLSFNKVGMYVPF